MRRRRTDALATLALSCLLSACAPRGLEWRFRLPAESRDEVVSIGADVLEGGCTGAPLWSATFDRGVAALSPPELGPGRYGLRVRARDASCRWIAQGCVEIDLPAGGGEVLVMLEPSAPVDACDAAEACVAGRCAGELDSGVPLMDSGVPTDAPPSDATPLDAPLDAPGDAGCAGCFLDGVCMDGDSVAACGRGGATCEACSCGGDACTDGVCIPRVPAERVSAGWRHACAIGGGRLYCWGSSAVFQVGVGFGEFPTPMPVGGTGWTDIEAAGQSTCGVRGGAMECWGSNNFSQLGLGAGAPTNVSMRTAIPGGATWRSTGLGPSHGCGIDDTDGLFCWGSNLHGSVAPGAPDPSRDPVAIDLGGPITDACAGLYYSCAIRGGVLLCWGWDRSGELGDGTAGGSRPMPTPIDSAATDFVQVACGYAHACARRASGESFCWGCGGTCTTCGFGGGETVECTGALGSGDTASFIASPVAVSGLRARDIDIDTSGCAVTMAGALVCWGPNESGELGVGDTVARLTPAEVMPGSRWLDVDAGRGFACGVREGGAVYCWGDNTDRRLGTMTSASSLVPARACLP